MLIFKAGARTFVEMEDDFKGLATPGNILCQYAHVKQKAIWGGGPEGLAAEGVWADIAAGVCGETGRIAALQGRPVIASVQVLGDADRIEYGLPPEYREAIQKFHGYARSRGLYTASIREAVAAIPKHDHYHFREDWQM